MTQGLSMLLFGDVVVALTDEMVARHEIHLINLIKRMNM
jgi:hypothetical protein